MKTKLLALFLLVGIVASYHGISVLHDRHMQLSRTFRFTPTSYWSGPPLRAGGFTDVICIKRLPNGETASRIVVEHAFMVDVHEIQIDGRAMQDITLRVTASEAEKLEEGQNVGALHYSLCRPDESRPMSQRVREYLVGRRKVTLAEMKGE